MTSTGMCVKTDQKTIYYDKFIHNLVPIEVNRPYCLPSPSDDKIGGGQSVSSIYFLTRFSTLISITLHKKETVGFSLL